MLTMITIGLAGFVGGSLLTAVGSLYAYGLLYQEAVSIVDNHLAGMSS